MNFPKRQTVYDRFKTTGMISGRTPQTDRMMAEAKPAMPEREEPEETGEVEPPNLRTAPACANCAYFDESKEASCAKFEYPCAADQVCDEYESAEEQEPAEEYEPGTQSAQAS